MADKKEIVFLEIPDKDFDAVTFVVRYIGIPNANQLRIQQKAWGIFPRSCGNPPIFPIYCAEIGWNERTNNQLLDVVHRGRLEDYALTFEDAVRRAYDIARKWADPTQEEGVRLIEYTRATEKIPEQTNKDHWYWYQD